MNKLRTRRRCRGVLRNQYSNPIIPYLTTLIPSLLVLYQLNHLPVSYHVWNPVNTTSFSRPWKHIDRLRHFDPPASEKNSTNGDWRYQPLGWLGHQEGAWIASVKVRYFKCQWLILSLSHLARYIGYQSILADLLRYINSTEVSTTLFLERIQ